MPRNIVICCDGTGNQIDSKLSNVLKLFRLLQKNADQLVYYSPGVGTVGDFDEWQQLKQHVKELPSCRPIESSAEVRALPKAKDGILQMCELSLPADTHIRLPISL